MRTDIVTLVSVGAHPVSLRPRLAALDARALGVALGLGGGPVTALHAGPAAGAEVLRACVGMGAGRLVVLDLPDSADPLPALAAFLQAERPALIVAGAQAEAGECSGMVPFCIAERLGYRLAAAAITLRRAGGRVSLTQALPGGRRRLSEVSGPLLVTVGAAAPPPPFNALARAWRAEMACIPAQPALPDDRHAWTMRPGRARARLLLPGGAAQAQDRQQLVQPDPVAAADAILDFLEREALFRPKHAPAHDSDGS